MDKKELNFMLKYMPKYERDRFLELLRNSELALTINNSPEMAKLVIIQLLTRYPFMKKAFQW